MGALYWNNKGKYQAEYDAKYAELVPKEGDADTLHGELIRSISRLAYEFYNNGNGNAREESWEDIEYECSECNGSGYCEDEEDEICPHCGGSGVNYEEELQNVEICPFYAGFLSFLEDNGIDKENLSKIKCCIINDWNNCSLYDKVTDQVMEIVLSTENKPLKS